MTHTPKEPSSFWLHFILGWLIGLSLFVIVRLP
jgi:hypothetical protein